MKIYKIGRGGKTTKFCSTHIDFDNPWSDISFFSGKIEKIYNLPIIYHARNKNKPHDYPLCANGRLVSNRFLDIIKKLTANIQIFPSEIYYKDEKIADGYNTVVFTRSYPFIDWKKSICENKSGYAIHIDKLVLSKGKLKEIPESEKIFVMKEEEVYLFATEEGKKMIEEAGIKGVIFTEVEVK